MQGLEMRQRASAIATLDYYAVPDDGHKGLVEQNPGRNLGTDNSRSFWLYLDEF